MTFMIRPGHPDKTYTILADELHVTFAEKLKEVKNLGWAREVAFDGWIRRKLFIRAIDAIRANGSKAIDSYSYVHIPGLTGDKVRPYLRVLDPADQQSLTEIDTKIQDLRSQIFELRDKREVAVLKAWRRGTTPIIGDLIAQADEVAKTREKAKMPEGRK